MGVSVSKLVVVTLLGGDATLSGSAGGKGDDDESGTGMEGKEGKREESDDDVGGSLVV